MNQSIRSAALAGFALYSVALLLSFGMLIYKVTDLRNGRVYIGQTKDELAARKSQHYRQARYRQKLGVRRSAFGKALMSAPRECFVWEVIDRATSQRELDGLEVRYIARFRSTIDALGYNCRTGGNRSPFTVETRRLQSFVKRGKDYSTPESRARISFVAKTRVRTSKLTEEAVRAIRLNPEKLSQRTLAGLHGISAAYVSLIATGKFYPSCLEEDM